MFSSVTSENGVNGRTDQKDILLKSARHPLAIEANGDATASIRAEFRPPRSP